MVQQRRWLVGLTLGLAVVTGSAAAAPLGARALSGWPLDRAHCQVIFTVTKWGFVAVEGRFKAFSGELDYDAAHPERSRIDWRVDVSSVDTGEPNRDKALQAPEYFDAARFPEIRFDSDGVRPLADGQLEVRGRVTIRGVTKALTVTAVSRGVHDVPGEGTFAVFETAFVLNRYDFGVVGGSLLGPAISSDVQVRMVAAGRRP
jgi:polyisoprenoid-binding protein YceI